MPDREHDAGVDTAGSAHASVEPTADAVIAFLHKHPDFLFSHPEVLLAQDPPRRDLGDGVRDFQQRQVEQLQAETRALREEQDELVDLFRSNHDQQTRTYRALLHLIDATSLTQLVQAVTVDMVTILDLDVADIAVDSEAETVHRWLGSGLTVMPRGDVATLMNGDEVLLRSGASPHPSLFGQGAGLVASYALARFSVGQADNAGLLAMGSRDPTMYAPGQGTELITLLSRTIERLLAQWLARGR